MRKTFAFSLAALALSALPAFAMGNPASEFCINMKGRLEIVTLSDGGQIGLCFLPNKQIIEEWTLFRMHDGKLPR